MFGNPTLGLNIHHHQKTALDLAVQKRMAFFTHRSSDTAKQVISHAMQQMMIIAQSSR